MNVISEREKKEKKKAYYYFLVFLTNQNFSNMVNSTQSCLDSGPLMCVDYPKLMSDLLLFFIA